MTKKESKEYKEKDIKKREFDVLVSQRVVINPPDHWKWAGRQQGTHGACTAR